MKLSSSLVINMVLCFFLSFVFNLILLALAQSWIKVVEILVHVFAGLVTYSHVLSFYLYMITVCFGMVKVEGSAWSSLSFLLLPCMSTWVKSLSSYCFCCHDWHGKTQRWPPDWMRMDRSRSRSSVHLIQMHASYSNACSISGSSNIGTEKCFWGLLSSSLRCSH